MFIRISVALIAAFALASCASVTHGRIVAKKVRRGLPSVYESSELFRYSEPTVFWVRVEGPDQNGRRAHKDILLWRKDWELLRLGDTWDCKGGFAPGDHPGK